MHKKSFKNHKGPFVIYGLEILRWHFLWQVADGGHIFGKFPMGATLFWLRRFVKSPLTPYFIRGKKTKKITNLFLARFGNQNFPNSSINELSLNLLINVIVFRISTYITNLSAFFGMCPDILMRVPSFNSLSNFSFTGSF